MRTAGIVVLVLMVIGAAVGYFTRSLWWPAGVVTNTDGPPPVVETEETPASVTVVPTVLNAATNLPDSLVVKAGKKVHTLTYTGHKLDVGTLFFLSLELYRLGSFVETPEPASAEAWQEKLLTDGTPKAYLLQFSNQLPGGPIQSAIQEKIDTTFTDVDMAKLGKSIDYFVGLFANGAAKGDTVYLVWLPGGKVYVGFKTTELSLLAEDPAFARALWRIWAGPQSANWADLSLKFTK